MTQFTLRPLRSLSLLVLSLLFTGCSRSPTVYKSPEDAASALLVAAKSGTAVDVLGPDAKDFLSSGDPVSDNNLREAFIAAYEKAHSITVDPNTKNATLVVGDDSWPFPVPMVPSAKGWSFDPSLGKEEILNRRVGHNELDTIQVCLAIAQAQTDYRTMDPQHDHAYAAKFFSDPGTKNGLYWPADDASPQSPLGELVATASGQGYSHGAKPTPYHGYFYKILTAQGPAAAGGAKSYLVDGKLTGGFAVVAWPAEYARSGVMTFLINQTGVVYQNDLGPKTAKLAPAITAYNPDNDWDIAEK